MPYHHPFRMFLYDLSRMSLRIEMNHTQLIRDISLLENKVVQAGKLRKIRIQPNTQLPPSDRISAIYSNIEMMESGFTDEFDDPEDKI